jgi:hypothetical protein
MIWNLTLEIYFLELLCVDRLEFVLHKCNVSTFETLDPFDMRHGILGEKLSSHSNGEFLESFQSMHCKKMYVEFNSILNHVLFLVFEFRKF